MEAREMTPEPDAASEPEQTRLTRREWFRSAAGVGIVALLPMLPQAVQAAPAQWTTVGPAQQFVKGTPERIVVAGGGVLYVTRLGQSALLAVSAKCTHRGCEVGWNAADHYFHCPCHGAVFGASGKNVQGTRRSPNEWLASLPSVPVRQQNGQVQVSLPGIPAADLQPERD